VGLVAHLGFKAGVGLHGGVVVLVEAVCESLEGIGDAHLEGAQALGVAFQGYLYRRRIIEEVVEFFESITTIALQLFIASTISSDQRVAASILPSSTQMETPVPRKTSTKGMTFSRSDLA